MDDDEDEEYEEYFEIGPPPPYREVLGPAKRTRRYFLQVPKPPSQHPITKVASTASKETRKCILVLSVLMMLVMVLVLALALTLIALYAYLGMEINSLKSNQQQNISGMVATRYDPLVDRLEVLERILMDFPSPSISPLLQEQTFQEKAQTTLQDFSTINNRLRQVNASYQELYRSHTEHSHRIDNLEMLLELVRVNQTQEFNAIQVLLRTLRNETEQLNGRFRDLQSTMNADAARLDSLLAEARQISQNMVGQFPSTPASSCNGLPSSASLPSGYYWVRASNGSAISVYCER